MSNKTKKPLEAENIKDGTTAPDLGTETTEIKDAKDTLLNLQDPPQRVPGIRLNIGSGIDYKEKFINIDPFDKSADISASMTSLPFSDGSVAQIICYEALEHIPQLQVQTALNEFFRVLKKDGQIIMTVPDMVSACERFLEDPENDWSLARIYGSQGHEGQFHKAGFTPKRIFKYCGYAGFRLVNIAYFDESNGVKNLYVEAVK